MCRFTLNFFLLVNWQWRHLKSDTGANDVDGDDASGVDDTTSMSLARAAATVFTAVLVSVVTTGAAVVAALVAEPTPIPGML